MTIAVEHPAGAIHCSRGGARYGARGIAHGPSHSRSDRAHRAAAHVAARHSTATSRRGGLSTTADHAGIIGAGSRTYRWGQGLNDRVEGHLLTILQYGPIERDSQTRFRFSLATRLDISYVADEF